MIAQSAAGAKTRGWTEAHPGSRFRAGWAVQSRLQVQSMVDRMQEQGLTLHSYVAL